MSVNLWFYMWLGTALLLGATLWAASRGLQRSIEVAQDALNGWRNCENHWRETIAALQRAERRVIELTQGDEWMDA